MRELLRPAFAAWVQSGAGGADGSPLLPSPTVTIPALEAACAGASAAAAKAIVPAVFLAAGVFARELWGPGDGGAALPGVRLRVHEPSLPVGAGLGSSAAFSVSTAAALLESRRLLLLQRGRVTWVGPPAAVQQGSGLGGEVAPRAWAAVGDAEVLARVNAWAFAAEMLFHGAPSGLDNTVST